MAVVERDGAPLIISAGVYAALRSWRLDGSPGELAVDGPHPRTIWALAVVERDGAPLIISAGGDGSLRSWRLDSSPGELAVDDAHTGWINALAVVEHDGAPLIISASGDGTLRSWRLDSSPGELQREDAHPDAIRALAVVEHDGAPLIISASEDGALRSWRVAPGAWARLGGPRAAQLEVRRVSFGSPLELEVLVPVVSAVPATLGFVLYAFKRLWTFRVELRIHTLKMRAKLIEAERELERLENTGEVDDVVEAARDAVIEAWNVLDATLSDAEDDNR
ncbi:MAG: WD40 repeat domain-containing protein [Actinobacteria bacterium]|nr:WD40 repeat domain-containing protein [Actinomycetota bacterium]